MQRAHEYLQGKQGAIEWTIFLSGPFLEPTLKSDFLGFDTPNKTATFWDEIYKNPFSTARRRRRPWALPDPLPQDSQPSPRHPRRHRDSRNHTRRSLDRHHHHHHKTLNHVNLDELVKGSTAKAARGHSSSVSHMIVRNAVHVESAGDCFDWVVWGRVEVAEGC
ncbi:hypothetical protein EMCG_08582 [[Emmonsia] crescens]|uniref:NmrA-like domain-containing protein n=1 Tax=[Emmonsia] crescens TaxID=73230 RepID=A0A0G2I575_9EURO|nr:hypothetical protein EMCG_08582 [Emmonsia crescens UAMH 3008]